MAPDWLGAHVDGLAALLVRVTETRECEIAGYRGQRGARAHMAAGTRDRAAIYNRVLLF